MPTQLAHPSPKRKRDQPPPAPLLNTALALRPASTPWRSDHGPSSGPDSPRNTVAEQLRGMTLTTIAAIPMSPLTPTDDTIRKKPKLDATRVDSTTSPTTSTEADTTTHERPAANSKNRRIVIADTVHVTPTSDDSRVIPETPPASQPRLLPDIASFTTQPTAFVSAPSSSSCLLSTTIPTTKTHVFASTTAQRKPRTLNRPSSPRPRPRTKSPSPPPSLSALTWQDSEITGHLADPATDPDDDGTGLNGIGFKPTPALAYARSQKRRQQLNEWKMREMRDARAKRSERRRGGLRGTPSREPTVEREVMSIKDMAATSTKRTVKFAI
ncbi:prenylcysteine lyase [Pyrenophora seminiperda CCB06]|uniref:Prenylcysteine lyase n=1 Tax=Pyrenophora seminiperda CCB06 TaxID=1302712 RepID=A0A3M7M7S6_9PLEO|nr:prenylcysteine lyase [Pyrenophora seminiperda CCB06]